MTDARLADSVDPAAFLRATLATQHASIAPHDWQGRRVWVKKAGPRNARWRYAVLGFIAGILRLDVLQPVMNLGGADAIAHEARRLRELGALGLRVPEVLAQQPEGLLISDLGEPGVRADTLLGAVSLAVPAGGDAVLAQWQRGLDAIARVHARGSYLSQAFARNLVDCADGVVGYIDFEDDPGATLPLAACQARDWLTYAQSTAIYLVQLDVLAPAISRWHAVLAGDAAEVRASLARTSRRIGWLQRLPQGRRWGRDTARLRAAALFLTAVQSSAPGAFASQSD